MADFLHKTPEWTIIREAWSKLDDGQQVDMLCELYSKMTCSQKDEFLRETGNP